MLGVVPAVNGADKWVEMQKEERFRFKKLQEKVI